MRGDSGGFGNVEARANCVYRQIAKNRGANNYQAVIISRQNELENENGKAKAGLSLAGNQASLDSNHDVSSGASAGFRQTSSIADVARALIACTRVFA